VCDASRRAVAAIGVHHITDSELGVYLVEGLEDVGLTRAAPILSGEANAETRFLEVTMALQNLGDWKMLSQVHQVAKHVEDEHDVTVQMVTPSRPNTVLELLRGGGSGV
jgi:hypothetical protein